MIIIQAYECLDTVHLTLVAKTRQVVPGEKVTHRTLALSSSHIPVVGYVRTGELTHALRYLFHDAAVELAGSYAEVWEDVL